MSTKAKILIGLVVVSIIVGISIFFYFRGKKAKAVTATPTTDLTVRTAAITPTLTPVTKQLSLDQAAMAATELV